MTPSTKRRSIPADDASLVRNLFLVVFILASLGNVLFLELGAPTWVAPLWAIVWMIGYLRFSQVKTPEVVRTDDFADNFYYLGFLLTLVALVVVLVYLEPAEDADIAPILSQFGLALSTTIVGLAVRTWLLMFRPSTEEMQDRAESRISRAFDEFTATLERLTAEADAFHHRFAGELESSVEAVRSTVEGFRPIVANAAEEMQGVVAQTRGVGDEMKAAAREIRGVGEELSHGARQYANTVTQGLSDTSTRIQESLAQISHAVESYEAAIETASSETRRTADRIGSATQTLETNLEAFSEGLQPISEDLRELTRTYEGTLSARADDLQRASQALETSSRGLEKAIVEVQDGLGEFGRVLAEQGQMSGPFLDRLRGELDEIQRLRSELTEESRGSAEAVLQVRNELAAAVGFLRRSMAEEEVEGGGSI